MGKPIEIWRDVPDFPYQVSNHGRVRRWSDHGRNTYAGRILKQNIDRQGYHIVRPCRDGIVYDRKVHQLVCEAFVSPRPDSDAQTRHLDGDKSNNTPRNLCWGTALDNAHDRERHGTLPKGEKCVRAKLSQAQVDVMRLRYALARLGRKRVPRGYCQLLVNEYGMTIHGIRTIISGRGYE